MNNNNNINYSSLISNDHETGSSGEPLRIFDASYNNYSIHPNSYSDYTPIPSKIEAFDYNYWPATNTHNILANQTIVAIDQAQTQQSLNPTLETLVPIPSVQLSQLNASATISATHHHHHIHQHLYPPTPSTPPPTCNDSSTWLGSGNYQALHPTPTPNPSTYRHYSNPCSFYPTNNFYDPSQPQWTSQPTIPIKFESSYSPPLYFETGNHCQEQTSKDELSNSPQQSNWLKHESSHPNSVPPKNLLNGKTRTRDKYRIVYTDQQRYELENEFNLSKYISIPRKSALSLTLSLSERQIKIWFQNRRAKERKLNKKRHDVTSSRQLNNSNDVDSPSDGGVESPNYYQNYTSHDYLQQQQQQQQQQLKSATAEMDLSVLWCLGPDFDKQTVSSLLNDSYCVESGLTQSITSNWWMSSPSKWNNSLMHESDVYTPRSVMNELEPQSPTSASIKRPLSDASNRTISSRSLTNSKPPPPPPPPPKLEFLTPVRSHTPDIYNRVSSSVKRTRAAPTLAPSSTFETPPAQAIPSASSAIDSAERTLEIALLLKEHTDYTCVLVTLIQEYQSRFQKPLHVNELYTMKHVIDIQDYRGNRVARLLPAFRTHFDENHIHTQLEQPFCKIHCSKNFIINSDLDLPFVKVSFKTFADNIRQLLTQHNGSMPLASFAQCYSFTFEPLIDHKDGVPLEHYISCIKDIQILAGQGFIKKVQFSQTTGPSFTPTPFDTSNMHVDACAEVQQRLQQFSREVLDLLKHQSSHCRLPVSKFVSAYHQYFNRQCRVADYGFSKILDLLCAVPKSVQILGDGNKRIITISHRCQMKRFTNDIIRILKNKPQRLMAISEIPIEYEMAYKKSFCITDFGMCYLEDLVNEIKDNKELVLDAEKSIIKLYRKERTDLEIFATSIFEQDVIDMLRILPDFSIPFQKFIPSYHHHFGYQCKVQTYGFSRLIDLLEELSHVVKIDEDKHGEKIVQLTSTMMENGIILNIEQLVRKSHGSLKVKDLRTQYLQVYRNELDPEDFGSSNLETFLSTRTDKFELHYTEIDVSISIKEAKPGQVQLTKNIVLTLMLSKCQLSFWQLKQEMLVRFKQDISLNMCRNELRDYVEIVDQTIRLTPPMVFAYNLVLLLSSRDGRMPYDDFIVEYQRRTGSGHLLYPADYGFPTMLRLFDAIQIVAQVRGRRNFKIIIVNPEFRLGRYNHPKTSFIPSLT
ncbi:unnamed protein product [Rotaria magnacalcarata]|uniref:Uncharacterized protein n=1 Tax=Rotaria magnacalcarata TaxID=392030 RepID=A0A816Y4Q8_9BILA|nr:unnamed protein product [Rotaria magnacalcarata]